MDLQAAPLAGCVVVGARKVGVMEEAGREEGLVGNMAVEVNWAGALAAVTAVAAEVAVASCTAANLCVPLQLHNRQGCRRLCYIRQFRRGICSRQRSQVQIRHLPER